MNSPAQSLNYALELVIESKLKEIESALDNRVAELERQLQINQTNSQNEYPSRKKCLSY